MTKDFDYYNTLLVQSVGSKTGPIAPTVVPSAAYGYADAEEAEGIFAGEVNKPLYARVGNPTNGKLESIVAKMEGGFGAIATASGMGALAMVTTAMLKAGKPSSVLVSVILSVKSMISPTLKQSSMRV